MAFHLSIKFYNSLNKTVGRSPRCPSPSDIKKRYLRKGCATHPEVTCSGEASLSFTNNQFTNNANGISLTLNGTSSVVCSNNTFKGQTSPSNVPIEITANSNLFTTAIENNLFDANNTGGVRISLNQTVNGNISLLNNTFTNGTSGSQDILGSSFVILTTETVDTCSILCKGNTFSGNDRYAMSMHTSGAFTTLDVNTSRNTISNNGRGGLSFATPTTGTLTLLAEENTITNCGDNAISVSALGSTSNGTVTINNNTITDIGGTSNGIAVNQDFGTLNLTIQNNEILRCEGSGIVSFAPNGINSFTSDISNNTISSCDNSRSNGASGVSLDQYTHLICSMADNTLSNNAQPCVGFGLFFRRKSHRLFDLDWQS